MRLMTRQGDRPRLTKLSLFSGIGGDDIAAEWVGIETVCFVENNKYCQQVLRKHWPEVPIIGDIHEVTKETLGNAISEPRQPQPESI